MVDDPDRPAVAPAQAHGVPQAAQVAGKAAGGGSGHAPGLAVPGPGRKDYVPSKRPHPAPRLAPGRGGRPGAHPQAPGAAGPASGSPWPLWGMPGASI
jgi:hypothetical protein